MDTTIHCHTSWNLRVTQDPSFTSPCLHTSSPTILVFLHTFHNWPFLPCPCFFSSLTCKAEQPAGMTPAPLSSPHHLSSCQWRNTSLMIRLQTLQWFTYTCTMDPQSFVCPAIKDILCGFISCHSTPHLIHAWPLPLQSPFRYYAQNLNKWMSEQSYECRQVRTAWLLWKIMKSLIWV